MYEFPARVLFLLMGIPAADAPRIKRWADYRLMITFGDLSPDEQHRGAEDMVATGATASRWSSTACAAR